MSKFPTLQAANARVLVVGDVMLDRYWFGEVNRISPEAPVPVVRVARTEDRLGGAANVARNAASLGAKVSLFGVVGRDGPGHDIADMLENEGIDCNLVFDASVPTIIKMRVLGRQQQLLRVDFEERPTTTSIQEMHTKLAEVINDFDVVVVSDYSKGTLSNVEHLIEVARKSEVPVLIDPKGHKYNRYYGATIMTPNRKEMQDAVGLWESEQELHAKAQQLRVSLGLEALLVTRSEEGMSLFTEQGHERVDAYAHEVFDVSGAGDTVLATLAVMHAAGFNWKESMVWANRAGGVVVGKLGTSVVTPEELS